MVVGFRKNVSKTGLQKAVSSSKDFTYMILYRAGDIRFDFYKSETPWDEWDQGVLFGEGRELRFRRRRCGTFHLVYLTADASLPEGFTPAGTASPWSPPGAPGPETPAGPGPSHVKVYLWGEWDTEQEAWLEGRFPLETALRRGYPLDPPTTAGRPALILERLEFQPAAGLRLSPGVFERFCRIEFIEGKSRG